MTKCNVLGEGAELFHHGRTNIDSEKRIMNRFVGVVELVYTYVSGAYGEILEGSSPFTDKFLSDVITDILEIRLLEKYSKKNLLSLFSLIQKVAA